MTEIDTITVGDLIRTYYPGYYVVSRVLPDEGAYGFVDAVKVLTRKGNTVSPNKAKEITCDLWYCTKVTENLVLAEYDQQLALAKKVKNELMRMVKGDSNEE